METLLNNKFYPVTSAIAFVEATVEKTTEAFIQWQEQIIRDAKLEFTIVKKPVGGNMSEALLALLPLHTYEPRRHLFLPTRSGWTAYFNNLARGTDAAGFVMVMPTMLECRSLLLKAITYNGETKPAQEKEPGAIVFDLHGTVFENYDNTLRTISLINEGPKWVFYEEGEPLDFEDTSQYKNKSIKTRFNTGMLKKYAAALGLDPFNEDFYLPADSPPAVLIEKIGPLYPGMKTVMLEEL